MPAKFELIAPCFFGCESTAKFELTRIGAENIRVEDGRLSFCGGAEMIAAANLNLRTVERVMLLLARYRAATFDDLFDGVYDIPWEELLPADAAFPVTGSSLNSQLSSVPACQSIIKKAVVKRLMAKHHTSVLPETGAEYKIRFMLRKDQCEIMLDTTGDGLHKRGYRRNAMEAPIRETLAATIADLGRVRRDSLVEDPFCGSGTLLIEAAQKASAEAFGVKDTGIMQSSIGRGKPRRTKDGRSVSIYPRGSRKRGNTSVREAEIGFINEFGKKGQSARPFIKTANERHAEEAVNASEKIYRNYVESKLRKG